MTPVPVCCSVRYHLRAILDVLASDKLPTEEIPQGVKYFTIIGPLVDCNDQKYLVSISRLSLILILSLLFLIFCLSPLEPLVWLGEAMAFLLVLSPTDGLPSLHLGQKRVLLWGDDQAKVLHTELFYGDSKT